MLYDRVRLAHIILEWMKLCCRVSGGLSSIEYKLGNKEFGMSSGLRAMKVTTRIRLLVASMHMHANSSSNLIVESLSIQRTAVG